MSSSSPPPPPSSEQDEREYYRQFERDYYALLGVSRRATPEEIRSAFRALSREFHPDRLAKRQDPALVALANTQYPLLDRAYKILSDPARRHVYDLYGERGVLALDQSEASAASTALGAHLESSEDMQREVERVLRRLNQQALEAQFSSFSEMSMGLDASDLVRLAPTRHVWRALLRGDRRLVGRTDMTIHQRTTFPLSRSTRLTLGGYMYDKQGLGMGCLTTKLEYTSSDPSVPSCSVYTELGWTPKLHLQFSQPVSPRTVVIWIPELDPHGLDMSFGVNHLLLPQLHGAMMWSTRDGLSASLSSDSQTTHHSVGVAVNRGGPSVSLQTRRSWLGETATTAKASLRANLLSGLSLVLGASRQLSSRTRLAMGVLLARAGVTLRLGFTRGSVRFVLPIFLSPFSAQTAFSTFVAATTPFLVSAAVSQLVRPAQERRRRRAAERRREWRRHYVSSARRCALAQQQLMARVAEERRAAEDARLTRGDGRGLVVLLARYGRDPTNPEPTDRTTRRRESGEADGGDDYDDGDEDQQEAREPRRRAEDDEGEDEQWLDVTVPLRFLVQDSTLTLPAATSKASLLGFYNPCVVVAESESEELQPLEGDAATRPQLYVRYAYDGAVFEATFDDLQAVQLPSRYAQAMGPLGRVH
ncbi:hypothetical protein P43SY_008634 [Pythium insidiosum]|uniref:J domain-containing protein n=1 Tax=Pythium insidiosum TaxID=114742 RepID=A0AAD5LD91_PYTIN|nr:hypothetical protein P43SY_008634 [Pythium insidiosum]